MTSVCVVVSPLQCQYGLACRRASPFPMKKWNGLQGGQVHTDAGAEHQITAGGLPLSS